MGEEVKISFYQIERCGYYKRGSQTPAFGSIEDILSELKVWIAKDNRSLADTCTFQVSESEALLRTFCCAVETRSNDFLLTTWNETPHTDGVVAAVEANKPVAKANVVFQELPDGAIPGFATYFWFLPEQKAFATVRFQHPVNGQRAMARYVREFAAKFSTCALTEYDEEENRIRVLGYRKNPTEPVEQLLAQFYTSFFRKASKIDKIMSNASKIRKIIRKNSLKSASVEHVEFWRTMVRLFYMKKSAPAFEEVHVKQEIEFTPSQDQLKEMITTWEDDHESIWDDIGFKMQGAADVQWLSHSLLKDTLELDVKRIDGERVDGESLLIALQKHKSRLMKELSDA